MFKSIQDPIWGPIMVTPEFLNIIDTPEFQRLHWIGQLGLCHMVFPGATHTRFQHSLGTMHIAEQMGEKLGSSHKKELMASALLHDVGHFPFSHSFEEYFEDNFNIDHESVSREIIMGKRGSGQITDALVNAGINPESVCSILSKSGEFPLEESIVSGPIDADEIDYLARDSYFTGVNLLPFDFRRIVSVLMKRDGIIYIENKGIPAIESLLISRFLMYKSVYFHKTVRIIQKMISRAVDLAHPGAESVQMNDGQFFDLVGNGAGESIVERVSRRDLVKLVAQHEISDNSQLNSLNELISSEFPDVYTDVVPPFSFLDDDRVKNRIMVKIGSTFTDIRDLSPLLKSLYDSFNMRKVLIYADQRKTNDISRVIEEFFSS
ncbi:MAG: HD domain-containing protein [Candidatus Thermoplasmatota archaeon]|jgi:HD superfamily phosphohydrolase|nr:HD domain-containing protein [Candidatus Thermoplasmatota archaeon]MCL5988083.1 HD domain-containing protein [Candidatus Thermoplasmatota archaeon]